jgi:superfamily I DNA and/or RNA helicase
MPGNLEHSQHSHRIIGVEASDLHMWMDRPSRELGPDHRFLRHDPSEPPEWAVKRYGVETARRVMEDHVKLDDHDFLAEMRALLIRELAAEIRESIRRRVRARVRGVGGGYVVLDCGRHRFQEGAGVGLVVEDRIESLGYVVSADGFLSVSVRDPPNLSVGEVADICEDNTLSTRIQLGLIDRIRSKQMSLEETPALMKALGNRTKQGGGRAQPSSVMSVDGRNRLDGSQIEVLETILGLAEGEVMTVVGPPGSGKTEVIAKAAQELVGRGERVLICSHTNRAVDNALVKLPVEHALRLGRPEKMLRALLPYTLGEKAKGALGDRLEKLEARIGDLKVILGTLIGYGDDEQARDLRDELFALLCERNTLIWNERAELIKNARVVGATLSFISTPLLDKEVFETVLIDESSQVPLFLALLGMLRARKWVLIGDHNQLLPIFRSVRDKTLLRRLSSFCYFQNRFSDYSRWLLWHYRSNPGIIEFPNRHVYGGRIRVHPSCRENTLNIKGVTVPDYLRPDKPVVFIDVPGSEAMEGGSRFNSLETEAVVKALADLLEAGVPVGSVGVIAPYRAQVKTIRALLPRRGFEVNTVDSYQGREKEVIVFSATGTRDMGFVEDVNRLNVALTRARRKLIVVANSGSLGLRRGLLGRYLEHTTGIGCVYQYRDGAVRVPESPPLLKITR